MALAHYLLRLDRADQRGLAGVRTGVENVYLRRPDPRHNEVAALHRAVVIVVAAGDSRCRAATSSRDSDVAFEELSTTSRSCAAGSPRPASLWSGFQFERK
jgi:hypothetical protein